MYKKVFEFIAQEDPLVIRRDAAQIPRGALVLSGLATPIRSVDVEGLKVTTTKPQNCVVAMVNGIPRYGIVKQIYLFSDHKNEERTVVILSPITNMFPKRFNVPTTRFRYYLYLYKAVVGKVKYEEALVVAPSAIQSVAAYLLHLLTPPTTSQVYLPSCCCRRTPSGYERVSVHDPLAPTGSELADSHQTQKGLWFLASLDRGTTNDQALVARPATASACQ
ncbi:hypothetical protein PCASD_04850 [Puccinia coronata f. sp. avenae]|uniref:Uncharacterized protein n=1 Tax=Puccinia coronata f. sp. avenae TaxID=200324 RepID=A0A2N5V234_9BASI|nr:hypothetical protein PCASD_04850 [Puccinia coronata f. sp. avenae]